MQKTHLEIVSLLNGELGNKLEMYPSRLTYEPKNEMGQSFDEYPSFGSNKELIIPPEYMEQAGANNSKEFLDWLKSQ